MPVVAGEALLSSKMSHTSLLLLPHPPSEVSFDSLKFAYGRTLTEVLTELSQISSSEPSSLQNNVSLDIAVASNVSSYAGLQKFFGLMYRLTCVISTEKCIDIQYDNDVDVRVTFIDYANKNRPHGGSSGPGARFVSLAGLARREEPWNRVFSVKNETGERLLKDFLKLHDSFSLDTARNYAITRVPGATIESKNDETLSVGQWSHHLSVAVGGTFDHLHAGHKLLLTMTALVLDPIYRSDSSEERYLTIGITGDDLLKDKRFADELETWEERQGFVKRFLLEFLSFLSPRNILKTSTTITNSQERGREVRDTLESGLQIRYKEIFDPYGPTIADPQITALVVSIETRAGGKAVNDKRTGKGWQPLEVFEVDVVDADEDKEGDEGPQDGFESKISSTEIRARIHRRKESESAKS